MTILNEGFIQGSLNRQRLIAKEKQLFMQRQSKNGEWIDYLGGIIDCEYTRRYFSGMFLTIKKNKK